MINPSELRRGNLINYKAIYSEPTTYEVVEVEVVNGDTVCCRDTKSHRCFPKDAFEPIDIDEYFLQRKGFMKVDDNTYFNDFVFVKLQGNRFALTSKSGENDDVIVPNLYVHSLQNAYQDLTGKTIL